jgi:hypothetical protein
MIAMAVSLLTIRIGKQFSVGKHGCQGNSSGMPARAAGRVHAGIRLTGKTFRSKIFSTALTAFFTSAAARVKYLNY